MINTPEAGKGETQSIRLSGTSVTTLVDAGDQGCRVVDILIVNMGSGTPDITIDRYDGTTAFVLVQEHSLTAKSTEGGDTTKFPGSTYRLTFPIYLLRNELLRVTSSVGSNVVHCHATLVRP